ncbi:hypothetical protein H2198_005853 [Neophaeococcomyces mojaviensis]|uniref:Uncharacterized protein n=1 Tax=Neophaeococcomyces mojaviensis TaxID=3383035 RepID=A0ACC3A4Q6_9EURO|nr:hypothetical protein H2198_005853 [Knufia sp. JES_112]
MLTYPTTTLILFLLFLLSLLFSAISAQSTSTVLALASTTTIVGTTTTYISSPTTPASSQYTNDLTFRTSLLNSTNLYRYQHNASYLSWNTSLASYAASYASQCIWAHTHGSSGENLARGYPDITSAVDAWGNERAQYVFSPADKMTGFSEATGHFTQLVWKNTQTVGCGAYNCSGTNGIGGWMLVCEYWPPGNVEGTGSNVNTFFQQNVQAEVVQGTQGFNTFSATAGATGGGTATTSGASVPTGSAGVAVPATMAASGLLWQVFSAMVGALGIGAFV